MMYHSYNGMAQYYPV